MFIDGFAIKGFRSFSGEIQYIGPFDKINLIIGKNNSGKSNVLRFLLNHYNFLIRKIQGTESGNGNFDITLDKPQLDNRNDFTFGFGIKLNGTLYHYIKKEILEKIGQSEGNSQLLDDLLNSETLKQGASISWLLYYRSQNTDFQLKPEVISNLLNERPITHVNWSKIFNSLTHTRAGGTIEKHWIPQTISHLAKLIKQQNITLIPAFREVKSGNENNNEFSGIGIIEKLAEIQNPSFGNQSKKQQFNNINSFFQIVTGKSDAEIEIPHDRKNILVHHDGKTLPLNSLGTGIHEVVIIASACTILQNQVICIEEPELHIHPGLQKRLIEYLIEKTTNQYFITTHSAQLINIKGVNIFHVTHNGNYSEVQFISSSDEKYEICSELGYKASDLLQSNCIIWVEGPSDRIYLNYWIRKVDSDLKEGMDYSIMFYGGRLLNHLSAEEEEVEEFISLKRLNRNVSIIIDSDKVNANDDINKTKKRIVEEFNSNNGIAWITEGREIENYIEESRIVEAIDSIHKNFDRLSETGKFGNLFKYKVTTDDKIRKADKIKLANNIVSNEPALEILDLSEKIGELVKFIRNSNKSG